MRRPRARNHGEGNPVSSGRRRFTDRAGRRHPHPPLPSGHRGACSTAPRFRDAGRLQHRSTEATTSPSTMTGRSAVMRRMKGNRYSAQAPVCFGQSRSIRERSGAGAGTRGSWRGPFLFPVQGDARAFLSGIAMATDQRVMHRCLPPLAEHLGTHPGCKSTGPAWSLWNSQRRVRGRVDDRRLQRLHLTCG